jgi:hypothetical protein
VMPESGVTDGGTGTGDSSWCSEPLCKLTLPQCGCSPGEQCSLVSGSRACTTEGTVQEGQSCGASALCAPGLLCVPLSPSVATCEKFCSNDSECESPGGLCTKALLDADGGTIPSTTLCSADCDPVANTGCPIAGTACRVARESGGAQRAYTDCALAGTKTQGASCDPSLAECAPGFDCVAVGVDQWKCLAYCTYPSGFCPVSTTCLEMSVPAVVGGTSYGFCF